MQKLFSFNKTSLSHILKCTPFRCTAQLLQFISKYPLDATGNPIPISTKQRNKKKTNISSWERASGKKEIVQLFVCRKKKYGNCFGIFFHTYRIAGSQTGATKTRIELISCVPRSVVVCTYNISFFFLSICPIQLTFVKVNYIFKLLLYRTNIYEEQRRMFYSLNDSRERARGREKEWVSVRKKGNES